MIDEKFLDDALEAYEELCKKFKAETAMGLSVVDENLREYRELLYLARLGLWAEKHGIGVLKLVAYNDDYGRYYDEEAEKAIDALPKDEK